VELFEFLGFMGSWLQVFTEVFGDYLANPDFKINMRFLEVLQFQDVWVNGMKPWFG
jgi:hypothetical protein